MQKYMQENRLATGDGVASGCGCRVTVSWTEDGVPMQKLGLMVMIFTDVIGQLLTEEGVSCCRTNRNFRLLNFSQIMAIQNKYGYS